MVHSPGVANSFDVVLSAVVVDSRVLTQSGTLVSSIALVPSGGVTC